MANYGRESFADGITLKHSHTNDKWFVWTILDGHTSKVCYFGQIPNKPFFLAYREGVCLIILVAVSRIYPEEVGHCGNSTSKYKPQ
jgi:hypothetical protein